MKLSSEQVKHIAWLARLGLSEDEVGVFCLQLSNILENFEILKEVDTENVLPSTCTITLQNVLREDKIDVSYSQADILANAPRQQDSCFKVRVILE